MLKLESFEPTAANVAKVVDWFKAKERPRLEKLWNYYDNIHDIERRTMDSGKPNNKLAHGYCEYVTNTISGYFMGVNVKYNSDNKEYLQAFNDIMKDNFDADENFELAKKASIFGFSTEILYQNEKAQSRYKRIDPKEMILIFGTNLDSYLLAAIRIYVTSDLNGDKTEYAEVYLPDRVLYMQRRFEAAVFTQTGEAPHYFGEVPVVIYLNNEEMRGDFERLIEIVDAYDKSQSDTANDFEYFTDAYLVLQGYSGLDDEDSDDPEEQAQAYSNMRKNRVMYLDKEGKAYFLTKDINDTALENYKNRLNSDIHKFGMVPDLSDKNFAGDLSGVAIRFKIVPLEQKTMIKQNKFKTALAKRREMLTNILNIKLGKAWDYREIDEEFTRNLPTNTKEETETILMLEDVVSKRTLLELLPQVDDVDAELERIAREQAKEQTEDDLEQYDEFIQQPELEEVVMKDE